MDTSPSRFEVNGLLTGEQQNCFPHSSEPENDDFASLAAEVCVVPIAVLTRLHDERQWVQSRVGLTCRHDPHLHAFLTRTMREPDVFLVPDVRHDSRFAENPLVTSEAHIGFYAGVPLVTSEGHAVGCLAVMDVIPRQLTAEQQRALGRLGRQIAAQWELRGRLAALEKAPVASEVYYRWLFESATEGILIIDAVLGEILDVNPCLCQLLGSVPEQLLGKKFWEIDAFREIASHSLAFDTTIGQREVHYQDLRLTARDGSMVFVDLDSSVTMVGDHPVAQCHIRDVSERKRAEEALEESQSQLRALIDSIDEIVFEFDAEGTYVNIWAKDEALLFQPKAELLGRRVTEVFDEAVAGPFADAFQRVVAGKRPESLEYPLDLAGQMHWFLARLSPIMNADGSCKTLCMLTRDITARKHAEEEVRRSRAQLAEAQSIAHLGSWEWDIEAGKVTWSDELRRIFGVSPDELENTYEGYLTRVHPDDWERADALFQEACRNTQPFTLEHRVLRPGGEVRVVRAQGIVVADEAGNSQRMVGTALDVTELKLARQALQRAKEELELRVADRTRELSDANAQLQAEIVERRQTEAELLESEARYRAVLSAMPDTMLRFSAVGTCLDFKAGETEIDELGAQSPMGATLSQMLSADAARLIMIASWEARETGRVQAVEFPVMAGEAPREFETRVSLCGENEFLAVMRDISERKRAEESLQGTKQMLRQVINHIPQIIFWKDTRSVFLGCNELLARYAGLDSPQGVIGKTDYDFPWAAFADRYRTDDREVMTTDVPKLNIEEELVDAEGHTRWLRTNKIPLHDQSDIVMGVLVTVEDVTAQKNTEEVIRHSQEEAERANLAKNEFLSRMSHELRTPLNAILGFGQILAMDQSLPPQRQESIQHILKAGQHLLNLINEVLDISRIEAGHLKLSVEPVLVRLAVSQVLDLLQPLASTHEVQLSLSLGSNRGWHVLADQQRVRQVLVNLVSNAIKYNRPGGQVVVTAAETTETDGKSRRLRLNIRDTGPGLSESDLSKLFTAFERLGAAKTKIEGTGIGLVLSQGLMQAMGGRIGVESELGVGSTFWIELPLTEDRLGVVTRPVEVGVNLVSEPNPELPRRHKVLYIEDNLPNLELIQVLLEKRQDVHLLTALQGGIGLDLASKHAPDLILLDIHLPDMNGDEVLRRLRGNPATAKTPVIVISADATERQVKRLLEAGARTYLTKPLDVRELIRTLDEVFQNVASVASEEGERH